MSMGSERLRVTSSRLSAPVQTPQKPLRLPERRPWREALRRLAGLDHCFRGCVFTVGLLVVLGGAALWMFSILLTAPLVFAGLWVWSWEFLWAGRLLHRFRLWLTRLGERARRRPLRWTALTTVGVASGAAAYYAGLQSGLL